MKILFFTPVFVGLLFLFSCGDEKSESPQKKEEIVVTEPVQIDACSFIDKGSIENIFNTKMKDPKEGRSQKGTESKASFSECSFESSEEGARIFLSVYVRFTPFKDEYHTTIQSVRSSFKQSDIEIKDIDGIGEVAFWGGNQLHVFRGDNFYIIITLLGIREQTESIDKAKEVAKHLIENLDSV
jgi:hypothetical protein